MATSAKKTTTKKPAAKKPAARKPAAKKPPAKKAAGKVVPVKKAAAATPPVAPVTGASALVAAKPEVVNAPQPIVVGPAIRKKEIVEQVVLRSGLKKRDVKPVVDHLLAVMGEALADGRELIVPPMGRVKVHKKKDAAKKTIYFAKVHQNNAPNISAKPLEPDDKDI